MWGLVTGGDVRNSLFILEVESVLVKSLGYL